MIKNRLVFYSIWFLLRDAVNIKKGHIWIKRIRVWIPTVLDRVLIKVIYILSSRRKSTLSFISSHYNFLLTFSMQTFKPINFKRCAMFNSSFKDYLQVIKIFVQKNLEVLVSYFYDFIHSCSAFQTTPITDFMSS